ncbi:MAG TPA: PDZ domain-containing protein, partial [Candidatus Paceibacterota bacterium]|nr:PDZ domain-containing protein [Candidatus Paceibacterota bacterium]
SVYPGQVVGINTAVVSDAQNIGFALPINQAKRDIASVEKGGTIEAAYLGVRYVMIDADMAKKQGLAVDHGALLRGASDGPAVVKGSPADKAGLQAEDIVTAVNGTTLDDTHPLSSIIDQYGVGDTVTLTVNRAGKEIKISVTLAKRPDGQ